MSSDNYRSSIPSGHPRLVRSRPKPAIGPRLRILFIFVGALIALLGANSIYLVSVTALESITGRTYQDYFYQLVFLGHIVFGLLLIVPFLVFGCLHILSSR